MSTSLKNKRILVLIPNFLPGYKMGGPLTSIINMVENLAEFFSFEILTSDRDMGDTKPYENIEFNSWIKKSKYSICYLSSNMLFLLRLLIKINASKAEIIYLNSLFNPFFSIFIVVSNKIGLLKDKKIIIAPRGETYDEALNFKREKKVTYIKLANSMRLYKGLYWHASTEVEKQSIIKNFAIDPNLIFVALNLTQKVSGNEQRNTHISTVRDNKGLHVVFLSRVSKDKNILFTFDVLSKIKEDVVFHIYGPIEDDFIWKDCKEKINNLPKNIVVEYKGTVPKEKVRSVFAEYDLMFLPTFAENFGHVIVESLSVGTPVLLSNNTPWRNLQRKGYGWDLSLKEPQQFVEAIEYMLKLSDYEKKEMKVKIQKGFAAFLSNPETLKANKKLFEI